MTVRIDRVRAAVVRTVAALTGLTLVVWSPSGFPHRSTDAAIVTARMVRGPALGGMRLTERDEPTTLRWTAPASPVVGDRVGLDVTGARFTHDVVTGEDATDVRDAVLALFTAEILPGVTIAPAGASAIDFLAPGPGRLWRPVAVGQGTTIAVLASTPSESIVGTARGVVELQVFARGADHDAQAILGDVIGGLSHDDAVAIRTALGVSFSNATEPIDLTALAGADWESRASMRLGVSFTSYSARAVETIEAVDMTAQIDDTEITVTAES